MWNQINRSHFEKRHLYGRVLEFFYKNPGNKYTLKELRARFNIKEGSTEMVETVQLLLKDGMIYEKASPIEYKNEKGHDISTAERSFYISITGFSLIRDIEYSSIAKNQGSRALYISIFAVITSMVTAFWPGDQQTPTTDSKNRVKNTETSGNQSGLTTVPNDTICFN
jgi:hypothetical protein